ncbi:hypothetical protein [Cellulomonas soli]
MSLPAARPARSTSLTGPIWLTASGAVVLLVALAIGVGTVLLLVRTASSGVVTMGGQPGEQVVAELDAPGTGTVELEAGERYAVHLVTSASMTDDADLLGEVQLTSPSGQSIVVDASPSVHMETTMGSWHAESVAAFTAPEDGVYDVTVPSADVDDARVLIAPDKAFGSFFAGIFGSVLGVFAAIGLGLLGLGLTIGGIIWWVMRARARREATA